MSLYSFFSPLEAIEEITVMNWNVCFFKWPFSRMFGGVSAASDRVEQVSALITETDADVVCLQEVFFEEENLKKSLSNHYPYIYGGFGEKWFHLKSGILIASKYPCEDLHFELFEQDGRQSLIDKGFLSFKPALRPNPAARVS